MADNSFKINKSVNFNPQAGTPANPIDGDFFYDSVAQSFVYYHNGSWANFDSVGTVATTLWLTGAQFTPAVVRNSVVKVTGGVSTAHLAGISASFSAKQITVYNAGTALIVVEPEDAMETTANNRIQTPTGGSMNLIAGEVAVFTYDVVVNRWLLVSISSQAGAQVIATTTNPGIVTLHQASLFPLDGIVLSDGDLNTANGVIGLDSNRAATIAPPTAAVSALTITGNTVAAALTLNQGASGAASILTTKVISTSSQPHYSWYDNLNVQQGWIASNGDINFAAAARRLEWPGTTYLHSPAGGSLTMVLGTGGNFIENFSISGTRTHIAISNGGGIFGYLRAEAAATAVQVRASGTGVGLEFHTGLVNRWRIHETTGALMGQVGDKAIQNVLDPVTAQDAATKNYVDVAIPAYANTLYTPVNHIINGAFEFWQRGTSFLGIGSATYTYIADRWAQYSTSGSGLVNTGQDPSDHPAQFRYSHYLQRVPGNSNTDTRALVQEIDRESVRHLRGKIVRLTFWAKAGANYSAADSKLFLAVSGGDGAETEHLNGPYTNGLSYIIGFVPISTTWTRFSLVSTAITTDRTTLGVVFGYTPQSPPPAGADDSFKIAGVMLTEDTGVEPPPNYIRAGGSMAGELEACQRYFEKSYNVATNPATSTAAGEYLGNVAANGLLNPNVSFKTRKRSPPFAITFYRNTGASGSWDAVDTAAVFTTPAMAPSNTSQNGFDPTPAAYTVADLNKAVFGQWTADSEI